jgi:hypothetical protein
MSEGEPKHLASDAPNWIAISLLEDVYGASGDFTDQQIHERLIAKIHEETNQQYVATGMIPVQVVANLIMDVWAFTDREFRTEYDPYWALMPDSMQRWKP